VFEIYDKSPENTRAMFGGGRYDNLVGLFGNFKLSGVGFGMGDVTLRNFLETHKLLPDFATGVDIFVSLPHLAVRARAEEVAVQLRGAGFKVMTPLSADGFGNQLKLATKHGARFVVLFGDAELKENKILIKDLLNGQQETIAIADAAAHILNLGKLGQRKSTS
jgi:histidyl-tRNA synthetase